MSKSFLFITPLTPKKLLTPLRALLFDEFLNALRSQTYDNWMAILIGDEEKVEGNIHYVKCAAQPKEIKLVFAVEYIRNMTKKPDFLIRIDDDDLINPTLLNRVAAMDFDCYADKYHAFYDIRSGKISLQERPWLANTVIHRYSHAMAEVGEDRLTILQSDHSQAWMEYYKRKNLRFAPARSPVYLRVLSPTTITSGTFRAESSGSERFKKFEEETSALTSHSKINVDKYEAYLLGFGTWRHMVVKDFRRNQLRLAGVWQQFSGQKVGEGFGRKLSVKWNSFWTNLLYI